jgi:hypothetical protein
MQLLNHIFDAVELIANRLPVVGRLLVELLLIWLVVTGARALLANHP